MEPKTRQHMAGLIEFFELNNIKNTEALEIMVKLISMMLYKNSKDDCREFNLDCIIQSIQETLKYWEDTDAGS